MLAAALRDPDPVLIFEHALLYNVEGELDDERRRASTSITRPCGARARDVTPDHLRRLAGQDAAGRGRAREEGIDAEVLDLRMLRPLDDGGHPRAPWRRRGAWSSSTRGGAAGASPRRSSRASWRSAFFSLDAPPARVCTRGGPDPVRRSTSRRRPCRRSPDIVRAAQGDASVGEFRMPSLGADMDAGTLRAWRVAVGRSRRRAAQIVGEVETEKGIIELEIWEDGRGGALLVEAGTKVPVGTPLARWRPRLRPRCDRRPRLRPRPRPRSASVGRSPHPRLAPRPRLRAPRPRRARPSRAARSYARRAAARARARRRPRLGASRAPGPHGAVTRADVERCRAPRCLVPHRPRAAGRGATRTRGARPCAAPSRRRWRARSARSPTTTCRRPHRRVARAARGSTNENRARPPAERILPAAVHAPPSRARSARCRSSTASSSTATSTRSEHVHLGVAIALRGGGLVAPAIHDAEQKSVDEIMRDLRDLVQRARAGGLRSSEMSDPTITVTNLGDQGVESVFGRHLPAAGGPRRHRARSWSARGPRAGSSASGRPSCCPSRRITG